MPKPTRSTTTETLSLSILAPDGTTREVSLEVEAKWEYERNPYGKEPPHYHGEDDGWVLRFLSLEHEYLQ